MSRSRIITIEGVSFCVSDADYDFFWKAHNCGEDSDIFKVACRRILGLGPESHTLDEVHVKYIMWPCGSDEGVKTILRSGLVEYEEEWLKNQKIDTKPSAAESLRRLDAINKQDPKRTRHKL